MHNLTELSLQWVKSITSNTWSSQSCAWQRRTREAHSCLRPPMPECGICIQAEMHATDNQDRLSYLCSSKSTTQLLERRHLTLSRAAALGLHGWNRHEHRGRMAMSSSGQMHKGCSLGLQNNRGAEGTSILRKHPVPVAAIQSRDQRWSRTIGTEPFVAKSKTTSCSRIIQSTSNIPRHAAWHLAIHATSPSTRLPCAKFPPFLWN